MMYRCALLIENESNRKAMKSFGSYLYFGKGLVARKCFVGNEKLAFGEDIDLIQVWLNNILSQYIETNIPLAETDINRIQLKVDLD